MDTSKKVSPLLKQYYAIKAKHPDILLLFLLGKNYQTFEEDAKTASSLLGIHLFQRADGIKFVEFRQSILIGYLSKLIKAGLMVAFFEPFNDTQFVNLEPEIELHKDLFA